MYAYNLVIKNWNSEYKEIYNDCSSYVYFLQRTGQVFTREHMIIKTDNIVTIPVVCPEKKSLDKANCSKYALEILEKIEKNSLSFFEYVSTGIDAEASENKSVPDKSSFYILRYGSSSPLVCGDTNLPIPLYKIPYTHNDDCYDDITFWENDYRRLFGLWLGVYEELAIDELQDLNSAINEIGRKICLKIEALTGISTYYFLFNYRNWSFADDIQRKCPETGKDWLIDDKNADDYIAFKCDESRLVSELSHNCNSMSIDDYLKRIGYIGNRNPTLQTLRDLQKSHLLSVPFENLDIHNNRAILLEIPLIYDKIVEDNRGGFCYELNGLLYHFLLELGFDATQISAQTFDEFKGISPDFDHLAIIVKIDDAEYLVDVGFGKFCMHPLKIELNTVQSDENGQFLIDMMDDSYFRVNEKVKDEWIPQYVFKKDAYILTDFQDRCNYQQTDPNSHFMKKRLITLQTETGRNTISGDMLKITSNEEIIEKHLKSTAEFQDAISTYF